MTRSSLSLSYGRTLSRAIGSARPSLRARSRRAENHSDFINAALSRPCWLRPCTKTRRFGACLGWAPEEARWTIQSGTVNVPASSPLRLIMLSFLEHPHSRPHAGAPVDVRVAPPLFRWSARELPLSLPFHPQPLRRTYQP